MITPEELIRRLQGRTREETGMPIDEIRKQGYDFSYAIACMIVDEATVEQLFLIGQTFASWNGFRDMQQGMPYTQGFVQAYMDVIPQRKQLPSGANKRKMDVSP